jgi:hypothetical protein
LGFNRHIRVFFFFSVIKDKRIHARLSRFLLLRSASLWLCSSIKVHRTTPLIMTNFTTLITDRGWCVVVFSNEVIFVLFNCIWVVWHFIYFVWNIAYVTVVSISTHYGRYVVVFNNVLISVLFNCMRVVWNMFCLELRLVYCHE